MCTSHMASKKAKLAVYLILNTTSANLSQLANWADNVKAAGEKVDHTHLALVGLSSLAQVQSLQDSGAENVQFTISRNSEPMP